MKIANRLNCLEITFTRNSVDCPDIISQASIRRNVNLCRVMNDGEHQVDFQTSPGLKHRADIMVNVCLERGEMDRVNTVVIVTRGLVRLSQRM